MDSGASFGRGLFPKPAPIFDFGQFWNLIVEAPTMNPVGRIWKMVSQTNEKSDRV